MGIDVPTAEPTHAGRVLFNPRHLWHDSDVDLVLGVRLSYPPEQVEVLREQGPVDWTPAGLPAAPPAGWESHQLGGMVIMYNGAKYTGQPCTLPDLGVPESTSWGSQGWSSSGQYAAVLLTSRQDPALRLLALAVKGLHPSSHRCYWHDSALNLSSLLRKAGSTNGLPVLAGSYCQGSLAGSSFLAHTPMDDAGADDKVDADPAAIRARGGRHLWATGVVLPPEEMEWVQPPFNEATSITHNGIRYGVLPPFDPSHLMFSTPCNTAQHDWPTLHLDNVQRGTDGADLVADYTLRLLRPV